VAHVPELEAKQLALVAWGLAKLSEKDAPPDAAASRLLDAVAAASIGKADQFTAQARRTAGMLHASTGAKRHSHGRVEERMVRGDGRHPQTLLPQGMANLVWSFGRLRRRADAMLAAVAPRAAARIRDFEPQGLCNLLYGYAVLKQQLGPQLAEEAVVVVRDR